MEILKQTLPDLLNVIQKAFKFIKINWHTSPIFNSLLARNYFRQNVMDGHFDIGHI